MSQIKYLGIILQNYLHWTTHFVNLKRKLTHRIGLLPKIRHYLSKRFWQKIYHSLLYSHLIHGCEILGQNQTNQLFKKLLLLQENTLKPINFWPQTSFSNNLLKKVIFFKSQILSITNMPYLLETPYGRKIYSFSMICLPHQV